MHTAPVLAVLVCHDGQEWLPRALSALAASTVRPVRVVAVDTGSTDRTARLLAEESEREGGAVDAVIRLNRHHGLADAVAAAIRETPDAGETPPEWLWILHDDAAPEPDCLASLLNAADASPSAGVLGPLSVDWSDPRLVVEAGLSTDSSGHRHSDMGLDGGADLIEQSSEVLAMPTAGALVSRALWDELGGFDEELPLAGADIDFGWRANAVGRTVLCVPRAKLRHARALSTGQRAPSVYEEARSAAAAERMSGLRAFLANCSALAFLIGVPRLAAMSLLRGIGFGIVGAGERAGAEFAAARFLLGGGAQLKAARSRRMQERRRVAEGRARGRRVRGLFVGRMTRLRRATRAAALYLVRRRVASEAAIGTLPESTASPSTWMPPEDLRAAAFGGGRTRDVVAVGLAEDGRTPESGADEPVEVAEPAPVGARPTPGAAVGGGLLFVEVDRRRLLAATLFAPPLVLAVVLTALALAVNWHRLGLDLVGGRLLPVGGLSEVWSAYLAAWHPTGGGTSADAPAALSVLGVLGAPMLPVGGPPAAVALLLLLDIPLAALSAYAATRKLSVHRWVRALLAAAYGLVPAATAAVAQGRVDVVVVHVLLPLAIAGVAGVLRPEGIGSRRRGNGRRWLSRAVVTALGTAVIGAFAPLVHVLVLVGALLGFVFVHSEVRLGRRIAGVAILVLLPIALLLPWPVTVVGNPEILLHGVGARVGAVDVSEGQLFSLDPGGVGALALGVLLVIAATVGLVVRPTWRVLAGVGIVALGLAGVVALRLLPAEPAAGGQAREGWTGAPLIVVSAGLIAILLAVTAYYPRSRAAGDGRGNPLVTRLAAGAGVGAVAALAAGTVIAGGDGPLRQASESALPAPLSAELAANERSVLVLQPDGEPPRLAVGGLPRFGADDLPLPEGAADRLTSWQRALLGGAGQENAVRDTVASASAAGVLFVVLPEGVGEGAILEAGGELVTSAAPTADGRSVVRLKPTGGPVALIAPELSKRAISGQPPTGDIEGEGVAVVDASLPDVRVRVSDGPGGRLLVLAATHEDGWRAGVNGESQPIVRAWGHQVAVAVPTRAADVVVDRPDPTRTVLLLAQVGAVLFTALTAIPARSRRQTFVSG